MLLYWAAAWILVSIFPGVARTHIFRFVITANPAAMVLFIVVNSFFEEMIVTGYMVTALSREGAALAITTSTLLRFLYHLYQGPLASISILPLGLLFGAVFWRWRNLWPLIVAHTVANLVVLMAG
jgi:membrane protease YdiL (CAAX protease family)